jgi:tetratricopeptide (TPR) repeat protein
MSTITRFNAPISIVQCFVLVLIVMVMLPEKRAAAQSSRLSNADLCNGAEGRSAESQIIGCSALIKSGVNTPKVLAIAYNNRGNGFSGIGEYERAIHDYSESINIDPHDAKPFNNRGVAYQRTGEYDRAIADFDAAISIDPNYVNAFANRGETYQRKGEFTLALKDFDDAIRLRPELAVLWNERCWTRAVIDELRAALADCNEAMRLEPSGAAATFDSRGLIYLKMGEWKLAVADFSSALRLDPKLASARYGRGLAKLKSGDQTGGKVDTAAAKAIEHDIDDRFSHYGLH